MGTSIFCLASTEDEPARRLLSIAVVCIASYMTNGKDEKRLKDRFKDAKERCHHMFNIDSGRK